MLNVKSVFHSLSIMGSIDEFRATVDGNIDPLIVVSPCAQICKNLRFTRSSLAPEKATSIESLEGTLTKADPPNVLRSPVMTARLVISSSIHFVRDFVLLLQIGVLSGKRALCQFEFHDGHVLDELREVV